MSTPSPAPHTHGRSNPIHALGDAASRVAAALMPSPFALAVILTLVTLVVALLLGRNTEGLPVAERLDRVVVEGWTDGLFGSAGLTFAFQMVLVLVTGHALALSPPVRRLIDAVAALPRSAAAASAVVALTACVAGYVHWGLGAVAGAMLARQIGLAWQQRGRALHYPILGAAAYSGLLVWHGGLSGSAPLKVAEQGHFLAETIGVIPVERTLFSIENLIVTAGLVIVTVALYTLMTPSTIPQTALPPPLETTDPEDDDAAEGGRGSSAWVRLMDGSPLVPTLVALIAAGVLGNAFWNKGFAALNLDTVNLFFLALGLALHGSPRTWLKAAAEGAQGASGIVLQFPLYFGILGMLKASGLIVQLSEVFVAISSPSTLPVFTFLSAGLVNLVVPSGGGQWAVQGPVMMAAARELGVPPERVVMALAYGDAWTNMLQPFWALPLLGIMRLRARDIIGYTTLLCLVTGPLVCLALWLL